MIFEHTLMIDGGVLSNLKDAVTLRLAGNPPIAVTVQFHEDDRQPGTSRLFVQSRAEKDPPPKAAQAIRDLAAGVVPTGVRRDVRRPEFDPPAPLPDDGAPLKRTLYFDELPGSLQDFSKSISPVLSGASRRVYELVRWRYGLIGGPRPYSSRGTLWAENDEGPWHPLPEEMSVHVTVATAGVPLTDDRVEELQALLDGAAEEPIAEVIFREATEGLSQNLASSLVMAMVALEVRVKDLISELVPDAGWLATNSPMPPIVRVLTEYLPLLPVRADFKPIPASVLGTIRKGVTMRNVTAHANPMKLKFDDVEAVVNAVKDVLAICDYLAGYTWALRRLSDATYDALHLDG